MKNPKSKDFTFQETLTAGIVLIGREVKQVAAGQFNIVGTYCLAKNGLVLVGSHIPQDPAAFSVPYETNRDRTLLVTKSQKRYLTNQILRGMSIIPVEVIREKGKFKIVLGIGRADKKWDKRAKDKEKSDKKEMKNYE